METYAWHQDSEKVVVDAPIPPRIKAKHVAFELTPTALTLGVKGQPPLIDAEALASTVKPDDSLWMIEDDIPVKGRCVRVTMCKCVSREWEFLLKKKDDVPPDLTHQTGHDQRASRLPEPYRTSARVEEMDESILEEMEESILEEIRRAYPSLARVEESIIEEMDDSILAKFPDDESVLGPFLGNLPPEILDVVVQKLGWFQRTFASACKACREAVKRVPSTRAVLTKEERSRVKDPEQKRLEDDEFLRVFTDSEDEWPDTTPLDVAVVEGDVEAMKWLMQICDKMIDVTGLEWRNERLTWLAAKRGKIESLKCLRANGCPWDKRTCSGAAQGGHLEVLQWAHQKGCPWDAMTCAKAAKGGHLEMLQWARENGCPWNEWTCEAAAMGGHREMLQWLRQNGRPWDSTTCAFAAQGGHLEVLQWLRENGCPWDAMTCARAAAGGHLEILQWLRENWCPLDEHTCLAAAAGGHLEVLQWARENGCPWDEHTCSAAAKEGHLEVLQWARENGCPWDEYTCSFAARAGQLDVLQWAHQNGCPWSAVTYLTADPRCRKYLKEHGCSM
jgi:hypothetical protein